MDWFTSPFRLLDSTGDMLSWLFLTLFLSWPPDICTWNEYNCRCWYLDLSLLGGFSIPWFLLPSLDVLEHVVTVCGLVWSASETLPAVTTGDPQLNVLLGIGSRYSGMGMDYKGRRRGHWELSQVAMQICRVPREQVPTGGLPQGPDAAGQLEWEYRKESEVSVSLACAMATGESASCSWGLR